MEVVGVCEVWEEWWREKKVVGCVEGGGVGVEGV